MGVDESESSEEKKEPEPDEFEWKPIGDGDGMQVQVDTRDNKTAYNGFQFGYYFRVIYGWRKRTHVYSSNARPGLSKSFVITGKHPFG
jgi:hypothetical protein